MTALPLLAHHQLARPPAQALAASLDGAVRLGDPYFNKLVRIMTTRCMTQALYFGSADCGGWMEVKHVACGTVCMMRAASITVCRP